MRSGRRNQHAGTSNAAGVLEGHCCHSRGALRCVDHIRSVERGHFRERRRAAGWGGADAYPMSDSQEGKSRNWHHAIQAWEGVHVDVRDCLFAGWAKPDEPLKNWAIPRGSRLCTGGITESPFRNPPGSMAMS